MKKLLGLLAAAAILWPAAANAEVLKNVDLVGEVQVIGSDVRQNQAALYNRGTNARVLAGLSFDLVEDVKANVLFQYGNTWGFATDKTYGSNVDHYWNNVDLVEANIILSNLFDCFEVTVGRQFYGDEDSAVMYVGPTHYNAEGVNLANAVDAVKLSYYDDVKSFTAIAGKVLDNTPLNPATPGRAGYALYGADFKLNVTNALKWQVYAYDFRDINTDANSGFYGTKLALGGEEGALSAEYARNFGGEKLFKEHKDTGYMLKVDGALNLAAFTPRAAFVYSANDFEAVGNYRPGLLIGDLNDVFTMNNGEGLRLFNVGVDYKTGKWTFALDGYSFQDRYAHHEGTWEADLTAKYAHNQYVELFAGIGYAKYGTQTKTAYGKDNTKGQLGMLLKF